MSNGFRFRFISAFACISLLVGVETAASACNKGDVLGVSRTVTLNTSGGKRYGSSHGGHVNFLRAKEVVLTFDDGPVPATTNKVLLELQRHCTKATFFMVGRMAENNPAMVRKVLAKGHTVGFHGYSHRDLKLANSKTAIEDVVHGISAINRAAGRDVTRFFRFPYLSENHTVNAYLDRRGYGIFAIDVDSLDYKFSKPNSMVNRVMSELKRKGRGIILLHDIQKVTASGLGLLLNRLKSEGYKVVHIKGLGGKKVTDPVVTASYIDPQETNAGTLLRDETSTKRSIDLRKPTAKDPENKEIVKRRKRQKAQQIALLERKKRLKRKQQSERKRAAAQRQAFRDALKKRFITQ